MVQSCASRQESRLACLLASRMGLSPGRKNVVRPHLLVRFRQRSISRRSGRLSLPASIGRCRIILRGVAPILRRIGDSPHISVRIERRTNQKILPVVAQGQAIRHSRGHAASARQIANHDWRFHLQRPRTPKPATLRAHHQQFTALGERTHAVQTHHAHRNLHAHPRAPSIRFGCQHFHARMIRQSICPTLPQTHFLLLAPCSLLIVSGSGTDPDDAKGNQNPCRTLGAVGGERFGLCFEAW